MEKPLVSICCITYNHEEYIGDAIEGFLMQKIDFPIEIIIHDDASTDRTQEIISKYAANNSQIKPILRKENIKSTGVPVFPITFEEAKGKYIAICEGDDYWTDPLKLQKQVSFMESNEEAVMVSHQAERVFWGRKDARIFPPTDQPKFLKPRKIILKGGAYFATNSVLFSSILIQKQYPKWFLEFPVGDTALYYLANEHGKIGFLNEVMSVKKHELPGSWTSNQTAVKRIKRFLVEIKLIHQIQKQSQYKLFYFLKQVETTKRLFLKLGKWILGKG